MLKPIVSPHDFVVDLCNNLRRTLADVSDSNVSWTTGVKLALQDMGRTRKFCVQPGPTPKYQSEYLLDLIWRNEQETERSGFVELAAEIEWGRLSDVKYDFEKLLFVKSPLKLMICDPWRDEEENDLIDTLRRSLTSYRDHRAGETYVVVDLHWNKQQRLLDFDVRLWECPVDGAIDQVVFQRISSAASA